MIICNPYDYEKLSLMMAVSEAKGEKKIISDIPDTMFDNIVNIDEGDRYIGKHLKVFRKIEYLPENRPMLGLLRGIGKGIVCLHGCGWVYYNGNKDEVRCPFSCVDELVDGVWELEPYGVEED